MYTHVYQYILKDVTWNTVYLSTKRQKHIKKYWCVDRACVSFRLTFIKGVVTVRVFIFNQHHVWKLQEIWFKVITRVKKLVHLINIIQLLTCKQPDKWFSIYTGDVEVM